MPQKFFDTLLNNTYEFPDGFTQDDIRASVSQLHEQARRLPQTMRGNAASALSGAYGAATNLVNAGLRGIAANAEPIGPPSPTMAEAFLRNIEDMRAAPVGPPSPTMAEAFLRNIEDMRAAPVGPPSPTIADAFRAAEAAHKSKSAQLPVTPATAQGPAANLPANPNIDQNTAAMMQAPGIVPRAPVSPMDQSYAAMMPSQGAIPQQAPMQGQGMGAPQGPYPFMDAGALNQIGSILQMASPVPRFPKVDRATAAALGNNFQPYMQARRQDIQAQQQDRRAAKENALRERAMFMQQQRQEQERRDRLAYQQMLMDNNEREEQIALKRFQLEADRAAREEQRFQEEQRQKAIPKRTVDENTGMSYWQDPATGQVMVQAIPELQKAVLAKKSSGGSGGGGGKAAGKADALVWNPKGGYGTVKDGIWTPLDVAPQDPQAVVEEAGKVWDAKREKMLMRDPTYSDKDIRKVLGPRPGISDDAAMYARQAAQAGSAYNPNNPAVGGRGMQQGAGSGQPASSGTADKSTARRCVYKGSPGVYWNGMFYTDEEFAAL